MKHFSKLAAGAAAAACMLGAAQASQAAIIDWTLSNGTFNDGGTFGGTFSFDTITDAITQWNVTTTAGSVIFSPANYSSPAGCGGAFCSSATDNGSGPTFSVGNTFFGYTFALTNIPMDAPGSVATLAGNESRIVETSFSARSVTGGQAVGVLSASVPEPAEWVLMIVGAALTGATLRAGRRLARLKD